MVFFFNTGILRRAVAAVGSGGRRGVVARAGVEKMAQEYSNATVGGGVEDMYGEDRATEEQLVNPWTFSVANGYSLLRDPQYNKGLAFTEKERDAHYLRGLLPPVLETQELQESKFLQTLCQYTVPLQCYMAMMDLQELNERLFYKLLVDNVEELLPVVYTPTVGEACQSMGASLDILKVFISA